MKNSETEEKEMIRVCMLVALVMAAYLCATRDAEESVDVNF